MMRSSFFPSAVLLSGMCLLLTGCPRAPKYVAPTVMAPTAWPTQDSQVASVVSDREATSAWWESFHDEELSKLIARAIAQNLDIRQAVEHVEQARAAHKIARSQGLPSINGTASYSHSRMSATGWLTLVQPAPGSSSEYNFYADGLTASWDPDFFGRIRHQVQAASAEMDAAVEQRHAMELIILGDLTLDYVQFRGLQAQAQVIQKNLEYAMETTRLIQSQVDNGVATSLDLANARTQQERIASLLPGIKSSEIELVNAMGLLLATPPRTLETELDGIKPQLAVPAVVPVGVPGDLVRRRPDVRVAESQLRAATAQTGAAAADFYPRITLSGDVGLQGLSGLDPFRLSSRAFNVGPSLYLPIFRGGQLHGMLELRTSQQKEASLQFQKTVLSAWSEVDSEMTAFTQAQNTRTHLEAASRNAEKALQAAEQDYKEGQIDFLNVIEARQRLLETQGALVGIQTEISNRLVLLYESLGGGWESVDPTVASTQPHLVKATSAAK